MYLNLFKCVKISDHIQNQGQFRFKVKCYRDARKQMGGFSSAWVTTRIVTFLFYDQKYCMTS